MIRCESIVLLSGYFGAQDYGCLADVLLLALPPKLVGSRLDDLNSEYQLYQGLQHILGPNLGVRLCKSQKEAFAIMNQFEHLQQSVGSRSGCGSSTGCSSDLRIWPLDVLSVACDRPAAFSSLISPYESPPTAGSWQAVDPVACFATISTTKDLTHACFERALYKACNMWILTASDVIAKDIIDKVVMADKAQDRRRRGGGIGCITTSGNRHTIGSMTITGSNNDSTSSDRVKSGDKQQHGRRGYNSKFPRPPVAYLNDYQELNQRIDQYEAKLDDQKKTVEQMSRMHLQLVPLIQVQQQLEGLRAEFSSISLAHETVEQELHLKTQEREKQQNLFKSASEQLDDIASILGTLNSSVNCGEHQQTCASMMASYNAKQLQQCEEKVAVLESRLCELNQQESTVKVRLEDAQCELQELLQEQRDNELAIPHHSAQVNSLRKRADNIEQNIANVDITQLEEKQQETQELHERLQVRVDSLAEAMGKSDVATSRIKEACISLANDYNANVMKLDYEDGIEEKSNIRDIRRFERMKAKHTITQASVLVDEATLCNLRASVLEEVRGFFRDGSILAQQLERDHLVFVQSVSSELQDLVVSREQQKVQWRDLQRRFASLQQQEHDGVKDETRVKKLSTTKVINRVRTLRSSDEAHREDNYTDKDENNDKHRDSCSDLDLDAYEIQMEQKQILLKAMQSKFQQVSQSSYKRYIVCYTVLALFI